MDWLAHLFAIMNFTSELYPFAGTVRLVNGHRMHVLDEGQGDTVIMLHGNPTWSFFYRNLVLGLRDTHRVLVPDHIGCGLSDKPDEKDYDYTLSRRVDDLSAMIEQADIRGRITLVMHDWGGMIGMTYAVRNPEKIARLSFSTRQRFICQRPRNFRSPCGCAEKHLWVN